MKQGGSGLFPEDLVKSQSFDPVPLPSFVTSMSSHLDENTLHLFATGRFDERYESQVESHLSECPECLRRLHELEQKKPGRLIEEMKAARFDDSAASETLALHNGMNIFVGNDFLPGDRIGDHFVLEKQLGRGGMGIAWKAFDETAKRYVVLKFVPKEIQHIADAIESVRESFQKVHALQHQHICPVYGLFNDTKHGLFLVMKYIEGLTLNDYRRKRGSPSTEETIRILRAVADGLDYAHRQKVVHRDIKPQNVMIGEKDDVQIIDFGLADEIRESLSRTGIPTFRKVSGTRSYMAPEQWEGKRQNARTDQYALAVTAYELFAGHVPFIGNDTEILRNCVLHTLPERIAGLPDHVNDALLKAMSKRPEDRFGNCKAFVEALENRSSDHVPITEPGPASKEKSVPGKSNITANLVVFILLPLLVVGLLGIRSISKSMGPRESVPDVKIGPGTEETAQTNLEDVADRVHDILRNKKWSYAETIATELDLPVKEVVSALNFLIERNRAQLKCGANDRFYFTSHDTTGDKVD